VTETVAAVHEREVGGLAEVKVIEWRAVGFPNT
jgi:hypothetical protein